MNRRIAAALAAILVLGGGIAAFVVWRAANEREQRVADLVRQTDAEIGAAGAEADTLLPLLAQVRAAAAEGPDLRLRVAEARILARLGRAQEAWDLLRPIALGLDPPADALGLAASLAAARHAVSGTVDDGRTALALAASHAERSGSTDSRFLAWQVAFRADELDAFAEHGKALLDGDDQQRAAAVAATIGELAGFLADQRGIARDALREGAAGDAGQLAELVGLGERLDAAALDALAERAGASPELGLVAAARVWDEYTELPPDESRTPYAEGLLRDLLERCRRVLEQIPSTPAARHLTVVALFGMQQGFGLDAEQSARFRGHLEWLLRNAPARDQRRPLWTRLLAEFAR